MMRAQLTSNLIAITIRLGLKPIHPAVLTMTARADPFARTDVVNLVVVDLSSPPSYPPVESVVWVSTHVRPGMNVSKTYALSLIFLPFHPAVLTMTARADPFALTDDVNLVVDLSSPPSYPKVVPVSWVSTCVRPGMPVPITSVLLRSGLQATDDVSWIAPLLMPLAVEVLPDSGKKTTLPSTRAATENTPETLLVCPTRCSVLVRSN
jgi:hypothetical protein